MFSEGIKRDQWHEIGQRLTVKLNDWLFVIFIYQLKRHKDTQKY